MTTATQVSPGPEVAPAPGADTSVLSVGAPIASGSGSTSLDLLRDVSLLRVWLQGRLEAVDARLQASFVARWSV